MLEINDAELASRLRMSISRFIKVIRSEVRHDELLSLTERSTLSLVNQHSEILPSELAVKEKVTGQSMSQIINKLSVHGYISKTPSQADKRKVIITITPQGREYLEIKRTKSREWLAKVITEKASENEKEILMHAITILTKLVD